MVHERIGIASGLMLEFGVGACDFLVGDFPDPCNAKVQGSDANLACSEVGVHNTDWHVSHFDSEPDYSLRTRSKQLWMASEPPD